MNTIQTEIEFELPIGFVDDSGTLHKNCTMRRATAADEILPMEDPRVQQNPSYLVVILLARVITRLGELPSIDTDVIKNLFVEDFEYIQTKYNELNYPGVEPSAGGE